MNFEAANPACCPLCGTPNQCAMEVERATGQPQEPCWCMQTSFPKALLDRVPVQARGTSCICHACALQATQPD